MTMGIIQIGGLHDIDAGMESMARAIERDARVEPDASLTTLEIRAAFQRARSRRAERSGGGPTPPEGVERGAAETSAEVPQGHVAAQRRPSRRGRGDAGVPLDAVVAGGGGMTAPPIQQSGIRSLDEPTVAVPNQDSGVACLPPGSACISAVCGSCCGGWCTGGPGSPGICCASADSVCSVNQECCSRSCRNGSCAPSPVGSHCFVESNCAGGLLCSNGDRCCPLLLGGRCGPRAQQFCEPFTMGPCVGGTGGGHCCVPRGGECTGYGECCIGRCVGRGMNDPEPQPEHGRCESCAPTGRACEYYWDCCTGVCTEGRCACAPIGTRCIAAASCCSGTCRQGRCDCAQGNCCAEFNSGCQAGSECCSGICSGGHCDCTIRDAPCSTATQCCSGVCTNGSCACSPRGSTCVADAACCSDSCVRGRCR